MMTNLFSTFDPTTSTLNSMNWISTTLGLILLPPMFWTLPSRMNWTLTFIMSMLYLNFKTSSKTMNKSMNLMFVPMFMFILSNNLMGLLPYVYTSSSQMVFSMAISIPMWLSLMIYGWTNKTNKMLAHTLPSGTPTMLMPFMVCIETTSNIIRPLSLAVRLTANMIAGHLFMVLLGNMMNSVEIKMLITLSMIQMMLMLFEMAVSLIQAYVFTTLSTLYFKEVAYEVK